jgi:acylphosphatase
VQGVFFRASTKEKAESLGLGGNVRNQRDGSVYIEAEGDEALVDDLIDWCHKGPSAANVERVEVSPIPLRHYTSFNIVL